MPKLVSVLLISCGLVLTGCDRITSYTISEQEINHALNKQGQFHKDLQLPGIIDAHIELTTLQAEIGREMADPVLLQGRARLSVKSLFGQHSAELELKIGATPYFDRDKGAVYLQQLSLIQIKAQPPKMQVWIETLQPLVSRALQAHFNQHPAWQLDEERSKVESIAKRFATGIEVQPGKLVIPLAP